MLALEHLNLSDNILESLQSSLKNVPKLIKLNLENNKIATFSHFPVLLNLKELNMENNEIGMIIELTKLNILKNLESLSLLENPITASKGNELFLEILIRNYPAMLNLKMINGKAFTDEEIEEADTVREERGEAAKIAGNEEEGLLILLSDDDEDGDG